jgi:hypothetical protein
MRYVLIALALVCSLAGESKREREQAAQIQVLQQKLDAANAALTRGGIAASKSTAEALSSQAKNAALTSQHTADKQQHSDDQQQHSDDTQQHSEDKQRHSDDITDGAAAGDTRVMVSTLTKMFAQQAVKSDAARRLQLILECELMGGMYILTLFGFAVSMAWLKRDRVERWANVLAIKKNVAEGIDAANHNMDKFHATNDAIQKLQDAQQQTLDLVRGGGKREQ